MRRHGILVGHSARQPERVDDGLFIAPRVPPEARSSEGGPSVVLCNRDYAAVPGRILVAKHDLLVPHGGDGVEQFHMRG